MNNSLPRNIYLVTAAGKTTMAPNETGSEYDINFENRTRDLFETI